MKTLKESILSRSSHSGEGFKAQRRTEIEKWLKEYDIRNYTINDDFTVDVNGEVDLYRKNLTEFPDYIQFGVVDGYFNCTNNKLTSLEGAPREVKGDFNCTNNELTTLEGAPEKTGGDFYCYNNRLTSLKGAPREVKGGFNCDINKLTTLEGAPEKVEGSFYCDHNYLTSLKGTPKEVSWNFDCRNNSTKFTVDDVKKVCRVGRRIIV